ncbi:MAG: hypothetical protein ACLUV0_02320 [Eubacterium sp.]
MRQAATGSGDTEQKVFEVKGCATGRGILCNLVVLGSVQREMLFQLFGGFLEPYIPGSV